MRFGEEAAERRRVLAAAWQALPAALRLPTQFLGRHYAGCAATIGAMPRCDFTCSGCYLGADANRMGPRPIADLKAQLRQIRAWLGPAGNLQLTDGEVTLRAESELIELIAYARTIGLGADGDDPRRNLPPPPRAARALDGRGRAHRGQHPHRHHDAGST